MKKGIESSKVEERLTSNRKVFIPIEVDSDPAEREELMMQADIMNGLSANKFS